MTDDDLLARLHRADPVADLPPADPRWVEDLLEETMTQGTMPPQRHRPRWLSAGAAAAVALVLAGGTYALTQTGEDQRAASKPTATPTSASSPIEAPLVLRSDPEAAPTKCVAPSPTYIAGFETAFQGRVTEVSAGQPTRVTFAVEHWYTSDRGALVTVAETVRPELPRYLPEWTVGDRYLVSANAAGLLPMCAPIAPWSAELAQMFDDAFAR